MLPFGRWLCIRKASWQQLQRFLPRQRPNMSPIYEKYTRLLIEMPEPNILKVTMNRPNQLNAADATMHRELVNIWKDVDADPEVSAVIITGAGKAFSAGGDLDVVQ